MSGANGAGPLPAVWVGDRIVFSVVLLRAWLEETDARSAVLRLRSVERDVTGALVLTVDTVDE